MGENNQGRGPGNGCGVLCLHGYTSTPFEVSFLAESLHHRGFTVATPTLPGHGTTPTELNRTTRRQWTSAVATELEQLNRRCDAVAIVGQSMGGLLALEAAARGAEISAVVALATPLWLEPSAQALLRGLSRLPRSLVRRLGHRAKNGGSDVRDEAVKRANPAYTVLPIAGLVELSDLMVEVRRALPRVRAPLLVVHGRQDHTAPLACADAIVAGASSSDRAVYLVPESYHLVAADVEREQVARRVGAFLDRVMSTEPSPRL